MENINETQKGDSDLEFSSDEFVTEHPPKQVEDIPRLNWSEL